MAEDFIEVDEAAVDLMTTDELFRLAMRVGVPTDDTPTPSILRTRIKRSAY